MIKITIKSGSAAESDAATLLAGALAGIGRTDGGYEATVTADAVTINITKEQATTAFNSITTPPGVLKRVGFDLGFLKGKGCQFPLKDGSIWAETERAWQEVDRG